MSAICVKYPKTAFERSGQKASLSDGGRLVLLTRYRSIPDDQYVEDHSVGARIGSEALTWAMQVVYYGRPVREGIFHIHLHGHRGETGMEAKQDLFGEWEQLQRDATVENIQGYIKERLASRFTAVADSLVLRNSKASPLFALCFAAANERGAPTALKIAKSILKD